MRFSKRLAYLFFITALLGGVIFFVEPPKSWSQASTLQILLIFMLLLLFFTFFVNLFLNQISKSFALGLGFLMLSVLKASGQFSLLNFGMVVLVAILLVWFVPKNRVKKIFNIPKLKNIRKRG